MKAVQMFGDLMRTGRSGCTGARGSALQSSRQCVFMLPLFLGLFLLTGWIGGCAAPKEQAIFEISSARYPKFTDDMRFDGLEQAIQQSLAYLQRVPSDKEFRFGEDSYSAAHLARSMESFLAFAQTRPSDGELSRFIRDNYRVYRSAGSGSEGSGLTCIKPP